MIYDKDDIKRLTQTLTIDAKYIEFYPDHKKYLNRILEELRLFGGNTIANIFRGSTGVCYREILCDVCEHLKVNFNKNARIELIEDAFLQKILIDTIEKMSDE